MTETLTLYVRKLFSSGAGRSYGVVNHYSIDGDAAFILETVDILLGDPLLVGFELEREPTRDGGRAQVAE